MRPLIEGMPGVVIELKAAEEETEELESAFHTAVESECPLALCVSYIRDHIPQLMGEEPAEESADEA